VERLEVDRSAGRQRFELAFADLLAACPHDRIDGLIERAA